MHSIGEKGLRAGRQVVARALPVLNQSWPARLSSDIAYALFAVGKTPIELEALRTDNQE